MLQRKIKEDKMKYRARARAHARCPSKLCWEMRSLAFDYAEYYVSFDAEVLFAFFVPD